ncbi:MAG: hypothetical protein PHE56_16545 [Bacteroidales bacterium]|nr:hypothetical protein [Bacteroidales bacterium]
MKKQLYLDIVNRLKTILNEDETTLFKHFDLFNRQVEFLEQETPFEFPAVFIEFVPHQWQTMQMKQQQSDIVVRIHIVTQWFAQTADYSPLSSQSLDYLDLPGRVLIAMQSKDATQSNSFMRVRSVPNHNHVGLLDNIEEYQCRIFDNTAIKQLTPVTPDININNSIQPVSCEIQTAQQLLKINGESLFDTNLKNFNWLNTTKQKIREEIIKKGVAIGDDVKFREYADKIAEITCPDANYEIKWEDDDELIEQGTIASGASKTIQVLKPTPPIYNIASNPYVHYDADSEGNTNSLWNDISGNNKHLTQPLITNQPVLTDNQIDGNKGYVFNGNKWLRAIFNQELAQPTTIFVVWKANSNGTCFDGIDIANRHSIIAYFNTIRMYGSTSFISFEKTIPFSTQLSICKFRSAGSSLDENQVLKLYGAPGNNKLTGISIGALYNDSVTLNGMISKFILYNRALSWEEEYNTAMHIKQKYPSLWT